MVCLSVICYVTELHAYDFVIKDFVIKRGIICAEPCILSYNSHINGLE